MYTHKHECLCIYVFKLFALTSTYVKSAMTRLVGIMKLKPKTSSVTNVISVSVFCFKLKYIFV